MGVFTSQYIYINTFIVYFICDGHQEQMKKVKLQQIKVKLYILFYQTVYGLTETTGPVCMVPSKHVKRPTQPGSSGFVLPGWEVIVSVTRTCITF